MRIAMALLALALATTGCKKKETQPTGDQTGSAPPPAAADAAMAEAPPTPDAAADDAQKLTKKAGNCPSTVLGATTKAEVKGKDVVLTITSTDKDAIATIQRRTEELLAEKKDPAAPSGGHDQKGTHGGGAGICPVHIPEGATATSKKDKGGVTITITAKDPAALKTEVDARIAKADAWVKENIKPGDKGNQGGVGGGKGEHGGTHSGEGDSKGVDRKSGGGGAGTGGGAGDDSGGGGGKGTGGGKSGSAK